MTGEGYLINLSFFYVLLFVFFPLENISLMYGDVITDVTVEGLHAQFRCMLDTHEQGKICCDMGRRRYVLIQRITSGIFSSKIVYWRHS